MRTSIRCSVASLGQPDPRNDRLGMVVTSASEVEIVESRFERRADPNSRPGAQDAVGMDLSSGRGSATSTEEPTSNPTNHHDIVAFAKLDRRCLRVEPHHRNGFRWQFFVVHHEVDRKHLVSRGQDTKFGVSAEMTS